MVQASWDGSLELCRWLKQQTHLTWIYCILLEDRLQIIPERVQPVGNLRSLLRRWRRVQMPMCLPGGNGPFDAKPSPTVGTNSGRVP